MVSGGHTYQRQLEESQAELRRQQRVNEDLQQRAEKLQEEVARSLRMLRKQGHEDDNE